MLHNKLNLNPADIGRARTLAGGIGDAVTGFVLRHSTVATERTVLRLLGVDGVAKSGVPLANVVVDQLVQQRQLDQGVAYPLLQAMRQHQFSAQQVAEAVGQNSITLSQPGADELAGLRTAAEPLVGSVLAHIGQQRQKREKWLGEMPKAPEPLLYVIVASGNIYEDVVQARTAARQGADIIAVIRSTGQSLLDYVPYGPTTEGYGGTYATQANFRVMRNALDEISRETGRYIRLCNYCSGLCMPEIAAMGAIERLDVMLNDALYGILFRDINMQRTLIDQYFSRMINACAGVIINTGEDNYLTTADAVEAAPSVIASQMINEQLGLRSGLKPAQLGLGHAFEMDPRIENGFLMELAQAQLVRELFPDSPIKWMPPTKYMPGNVFLGHVYDAMFNLVGIATQQSISLLGMMTEAIHTPHIHDRYLAIESAKYIYNNARLLGDELEFKPGGRIQARAQTVLRDAIRLLETIAKQGLFSALEQGCFADVKRQKDGGRGFNGVLTRADGYFNPFEKPLRAQLGLPRLGASQGKPT